MDSEKTIPGLSDRPFLRLEVSESLSRNFMRLYNKGAGWFPVWSGTGLSATEAEKLLSDIVRSTLGAFADHLVQSHEPGSHVVIADEARVIFCAGIQVRLGRMPQKYRSDFSGKVLEELTQFASRGKVVVYGGGHTLFWSEGDVLHAIVGWSRH